MIDWKGWKVKYANAFGGSERALFLLQHDLFANFPEILAQHEADQATIAALRQQGEPVAWLHVDGESVISAAELAIQPQWVKDEVWALKEPLYKAMIAAKP